jgi:hypothetical protein
MLLLVLMTDAEINADITAAETRILSERLDLIIQAFKEKKLSLLEPHFANDIQVAGYSGNMVPQVILQAFEQVPPIEFFDIKKIEKKGDQYHVSFIMKLANIQPLNRDIVFNSSFQFKEINMFAARTQTQERTKEEMEEEEKKA